MQPLLCDRRKHSTASGVISLGSANEQFTGAVKAFAIVVVSAKQLGCAVGDGEEWTRLIRGPQNCCPTLVLPPNKKS